MVQNRIVCKLIPSIKNSAVAVVPSEMTAAAAKHPPLSPPLSFDSDSGSETESPSHSSSSIRRHPDLSSSIFQSYLSHSSSAHSDQNQDLIKIQSFLTSSRSGALSCLICLERIKLTDPTWSCSSRCFALFHLLCIQSWAHQSTTLAFSRASTRAAVVPDENSLVWPCPKCRIEYAKFQTPKYYYCFCGKVQDPPRDPWVLPHSCGEICGRALRHECGHFCLLLCHPGPCPPCPKLVRNKCYCGKLEDVRRCAFKNFTCDAACGKLLECRVHGCREICHEGSCPPCTEKGTYMCQCRKVEMERACFERDFRCSNPCDKPLGCGRHDCGRGCHDGECGDCPLQGKRSCPCGKRAYEGMACDASVPLCGATCEKLLSCGFHRCPERCHRGSCLDICRVVITKSCTCGSLKKQIPCHQELTCERKCQKLRDCGRHACKRRCCNGDCPPCSEICDRRLRCRNHKCPAPCHRGPCAPCPLMVRISCSCGQTHFEVPCGTENEQKPPRCRKTCPVAPLCRHGPNTKPHKCHYGACPPCRLVCDEEYSCGHRCQLRCHGPKPPSRPEFSLKPKKKKSEHLIEATPGVLCPPCPELVLRSCLGDHIGEERMMVCSNKVQFSCDNLCGNPLPCGNHYCTYVCHALKNNGPKSEQIGRPCEECNLPCQKERDPACRHNCPLPCHPGDCPPCKALIRRSCHCGAMVHVFECNYFNCLSEKEQMAARSCKGPCHRKLPNCAHLCPETCHPGPCPFPEKCSKKVSVRCRCQNLKQEWLCQEVQAVYSSTGCEPKDVPKNQYGHGILPCNHDCQSKQKVVGASLHFRSPIPQEEHESDKVDQGSKRRRRKRRVHETETTSRLQKVVAVARRVIVLVVVVLLLTALAYIGYKSLLWLSERMNEHETRQRRRYSRFHSI